MRPQYSNGMAISYQDRARPAYRYDTHLSTINQRRERRASVALARRGLSSVVQMRTTPGEAAPAPQISPRDVEATRDNYPDR